MSEITFVFPFQTIPVSLTGKKCALQCKHCNKHYLEHMLTLDKLKGNERSVLISGGCNSNGVVPLLKFKEKLGEIKKRSKIAVHPGLFPPKEARKLKGFADRIAFDFIGSDETIREVYGLKKSVNDYLTSFCALAKQVPTIPHLTIGLHGGKIKGEWNALDLLCSSSAKTIVFNVFIPTPGTAYESFFPPPIKDVLELLMKAKGEFSKVFLGCMRPGGSYREKLDSKAIALEAVDRIVMPPPNIFKKVKDPSFTTECCIL
jgi:hypothetical protein